MQKIVATTITCSLLLSAGAIVSGCAMPFPSKPADAGLVPFSSIPSATYLGMVTRWDNEKQPVLCAVIRSQNEWQHWFQPAATTRRHRAPAPPAAFFATRQLLLAARVMPAPDSSERGQVFVAEAVVMRDGMLQLTYRYRKPLSGATYQVNDFLLLEIAKDRYTTGPVRFIENGANVCEIAR